MPGALPAGNSNGPVIKFNGYSPMVSLQNSNIEMKGFALESYTGGTPLGTVNCINLEGAINYITMTYNTVTMGPKRAGVSVDNNNTVQNASISYCRFIGPDHPGRFQLVYGRGGFFCA